MNRADLTAREVAAMLTRAGARFIEHILPNAKKDAKHSDWMRVGSTAGEAGTSLVIRLAGTRAGTWVDWANDPRPQDFIRLIMITQGLDLHDAIEYACDWLGIVDDDSATPAKPNARPAKNISKPIETRAPSPSWLRLQSSLRKGTVTELSHVATLRKLPSIAALELATRHDQLYFADVWDDDFEWPAWIITDPSRRNAQARRMDGQPWSGIGGKKAKTITGCEANWPVGIHDIKTRGIALVEGGPDFLAAWHFIWIREQLGRVQPVAMFGASQPIHPDALPLFANKDVWIFPHADDAGAKGAARWRASLSHAASVSLWDFSQHQVKDLNDFVRVQDVAEQLKEAADVS